MVAISLFLNGSAAWSLDEGFQFFEEERIALEGRAAGLTVRDFRRRPVAITELDAKDVEQSGARDINHLLEIHVPNAQFIDHHHLQPHLGFRGIISDREDKYLYQVNGRTMNNRTSTGANNERGIPLVGDIQSIAVVRGPASATHGVGALAGVIDVMTYNGLTFQGLDFKARQGFVDEYSAGELRYGRRFSETSGVFLYYGLAEVQGADSAYYIGKSYPASNGLPPNVGGEEYNGPMAGLGESAFGQLQHKLHLNYVNGPYEFWARFVQDGRQARPMREIYSSTRPANVTLDDWTRGRQQINRQYTATARYKKNFNPQWGVDLMQSYDLWSFEDERAGVFSVPLSNTRENELFSRAIGLWTPNRMHSLAFGTEYSHEWFHVPPTSDALDRAPVITDRDWHTNTISLLAEHQWKINDLWTTFLSYRTDKHTYTRWLPSGRGTLVFTPTEKDTFKLMAGQSARRGVDEELWSQWVRAKTIPDPETLRSYELMYERKLKNNWRFSGNAFYEDYDALGWIPTLYQSSSVGEFQIAGGEIELTYETDRTRFTFSEGVSKLVDASLPASLPQGGQGITAEPYGFGSDLAEWAPFITKLALTHDFSKKWSGSSSIVHYSGFPGAKDYADYGATLSSPPSAFAFSDRGNNDAYGANLYVNLGLEMRPTDQWTLRLDAYNLAELVDDKLSKRNHYFRLSEYSVQPASVALSVRYRLGGEDK